MENNCFSLYLFKKGCRSPFSCGVRDLGSHGLSYMEEIENATRSLRGKEAVSWITSHCAGTTQCSYDNGGDDNNSHMTIIL